MSRRRSPPPPRRSVPSTKCRRSRSASSRPTLARTRFRSDRSIGATAQPSRRSLVSHVYAGSGTSTVTLIATDEDGPKTFLKTITVADVAPTLTLTAPSTASEGSTINVTFGATDPGNDVVGGWQINWGDGSAVVNLDGTATGASKQCLDNGVYTITLKASEPDGVFTTTKTITINNVAPTMTANVPEGTSFPINFSATDPGLDTISHWAINWGDGSAMTTKPGTAMSATKTYSTRGTITLTATDKDGSYSTVRSILASSVAPTLTLASPATSDEGDSTTFNFGVTDPGADTISQWVIKWGDGNATSGI